MLGTAADHNAEHPGFGPPLAIPIVKRQQRFVYCEAYLAAFARLQLHQLKPFQLFDRAHDRSVAVVQIELYDFPALAIASVFQVYCDGKLLAATDSVCTKL